MIHFLQAYDVFLTISLDGSQPVHDTYRRFADGRGSFEQVYQNLHRLREMYPRYYEEKVMYNAVLRRDDSFFVADKFFTEDSLFETNEISFTFFNDNYVKKDIETDTSRFQEAYEFYRYEIYCNLLGKIRRKPSRMQLSYIQELKNTIRDLRRHATLPASFHPSGPCVPGQKKLFLNADGNFFPCERVNELSPSSKIGDVQTGIDPHRCKILMNVGTLTEEACKRCWAFLYCKGCFIQADGGNQLVASARLQHCNQQQQMVLEQFKDICMLKKHGVDLFEERV